MDETLELEIALRGERRAWSADDAGAAPLANHAWEDFYDETGFDLLDDDAPDMCEWVS
jgi:hypothetical protein